MPCLDEEAEVDGDEVESRFGERATNFGSLGISGCSELGLSILLPPNTSRPPHPRPALLLPGYFPDPIDSLICASHNVDTAVLLGMRRHALQLQGLRFMHSRGLVKLEEVDCSKFFTRSSCSHPTCG